MTTQPDTFPPGPGTIVTLEHRMWGAVYIVVGTALGCGFLCFGAVSLSVAAFSGRLPEPAPLGLVFSGGVLTFLMLGFSASLVAGVRAVRGRPVLWVGVDEIALHDRRVLAHDLVLPRSMIEHVRVIEDDGPWSNQPRRDEFTCSPFHEKWTIRVRLNEAVSCDAHSGLFGNWPWNNGLRQLRRPVAVPTARVRYLGFVCNPVDPGAALRALTSLPAVPD
jgi:hypothetical protein